MAADDTKKEDAQDRQVTTAQANADTQTAASKPDSTKSKMVKAIGVKDADVTAYNTESHTLVTAQGGKYQMAADGKTLRWLGGPKPKAIADAEEAGEA